jgi:hypothetical protein
LFWLGSKRTLRHAALALQQVAVVDVVLAASTTMRVFPLFTVGIAVARRERTRGG